MPEALNWIAKLPSADPRGGYIEDKLGVPNAGVLHPFDLARISGVAFAGDEIAYRLPNWKNYSQQVADQYSIKFPNLMRGLPADTFRDIYADLIGKGDYGRSRVAKVLAKKPRQLQEQDFLDLQADLADIFVQTYMRNEVNVPDTVAHIRRGFITVGDVFSFPLPFSPEVVVEYGPGLVGLRRIDEVADITHTVLIENNTFKSFALSAYSRIVTGDLDPNKIVNRADGMQTATHDMLTGGYENRVNIIIATSIQSAGQKELEVAIQNTYPLLANGGLFVMHGEDAFPGSIGIDEMMHLARQSFGEPLRVEHVQVIQQTTGKRGRGKATLFQK